MIKVYTRQGVRGKWFCLCTINDQSISFESHSAKKAQLMMIEKHVELGVPKADIEWLPIQPHPNFK